VVLCGDLSCFWCENDMFAAVCVVMCAQGKSVPCKSFMTREASATGRARGITALAVNKTSSKLLASSADHHIYMFDCIVPEREPAMFSGHLNSSFYVKSAFSPDGRFIMSGSTDNHVYIWDVANPLMPPLRLKGHAGEVSDVAWSPTEFWKLASSSDDTTVRIWTIDRAMSEHLRTNQESTAQIDGAHSGRQHMDRPMVYDRNAVWHVAACTGSAVAPPSWSQPLQQSEEDLLTCHETMMFSDTVSSVLEHPEHDSSGEEDRSSASVVLFADGRAESPTEGVVGPRLQTGSPWVPDILLGEENTRRGRGTDNTPSTTLQVSQRRTMRSPALKQPRLTDFFKQHDEAPTPSGESQRTQRAQPSGNAGGANSNNASAGATPLFHLLSPVASKRHAAEGWRAGEGECEDTLAATPQTTKRLRPQR
jgi:hypothetical protein